MSRASFFVPLGVFVLLAGLLLAGFFLEDQKVLPSALIDRQVPEFSLAELHSGRQLTRADLPAGPALINVWASWCPGCLVEHPWLMRIAAEKKIALVGVNYRDDAGAARNWLQRHGNPYSFSLHDPEGLFAIDLGVYGAPETFVLDHEGVIRYRHTGALDAGVWKETLEPLLQKYLQDHAAARRGEQI